MLEVATVSGRICYHPLALNEVLNTANSHERKPCLLDLDAYSTSLELTKGVFTCDKPPLATKQVWAE